jgi:hypothetical protein
MVAHQQQQFAQLQEQSLSAHQQLSAAQAIAALESQRQQ